MPPTTSKKIKTLLWILIPLIVLLVIAQLVFSQQVKKVIAAQTPENISLQYADLSTNFFMGKIQLEAVEIKNDSTSDAMSIEKITVKGLHYLPLLTNKSIKMDQLLVEAPHGQFRKPNLDSTKTNPAQKAIPSLSIKNLAISNGQLNMLKEESDSVLLQVEGLNLRLADLHFDEETAQNALPLTFGEHQFNTKKLYFNLGPYVYLQWEEFALNSEKAEIQQLVLGSKYSKEELARKISVEHDHIDLSVANITLNQPDFIGSDAPKLHAPSIEIARPVISINRNALKPRENIIKKMPNHQLRELEADLQIDSILVTDGEVNFSKKTMADVVPEKLSLNDLNVRMKNLHNKGEGLVVVDVENKIMDEGLFQMTYTFDPKNTDNAFLAKGSISDFHTKSIGPFMRSTLNAEVDGTIDQMYFTIDGNEWSSIGEMKMAYDQFKFVALKKDHERISKLKSSIANLVTKKGHRKADDDGFRHGRFKVERDRTRFVANYIWLNMKAGMMHTLIGSGKER